MRLLLFFIFALSHFSANSQKILLLERANNARPSKMYIGDPLLYRVAGKENYWYDRTITDMLPDRSIVLLDNFPVELGDISHLKVRRKPVWRITGGAMFAFGASLALATTIAAIYRDEGTNYGALYGASAGSLGIGYFLNTRRTLKMGEKHRLRMIEINFAPPPIQR